jgi:LPXTG-motif cell wall-anchored protein
MPVTRKRKIEVARLAGFGLVLAGLFALFLAVMSAQNAGAVKAAPRNATLHCYHSSQDGIGGAVQYGACDTTTTLADQGATSTTQKYHHCGCQTTTTLADQGVTSTTEKTCGCDTTTTLADQGVTSTTEKTCGCTTSTTEATTTSTEASGDTTTSMETTTTYAGLGETSTTAATTTTVHGQGGPVTTIGTQGNGPTGNQGPVSGAEAANAQQLPFTGSSSFPLAGIGVLLVATGLALSLRRRRLAR